MSGEVRDQCCFFGSLFYYKLKIGLSHKKNHVDVDDDENYDAIVTLNVSHGSDGGYASAVVQILLAELAPAICDSRKWLPS